MQGKDFIELYPFLFKMKGGGRHKPPSPSRRSSAPAALPLASRNFQHPLSLCPPKWSSVYD